MSKDIADMIFAVAFVQELQKGRMRTSLASTIESSQFCADIAEQARDFYLAGLPPGNQVNDETAFFSRLFTEEMFEIWNDYSVRTRKQAVSKILQEAKEFYPEWKHIEESFSQWEEIHKAFFPLEDDRDHYAKQLIKLEIDISDDKHIGYTVVVGRETLSWKRLVNFDYWSKSH